MSNEPAFPQCETRSGNPFHAEFPSGSGIDIRDYFAGIAFPWALETNSANAIAIAEALGVIGNEQKMNELRDATLNAAASAAYSAADAMLKAREQTP